MPPVRGHNEGSIFRRADTQHKVAVISLADGRRVSRSCPHRHGERDKDCPEVKAHLRDLLRLREQGTEAVDGSRMTVGQFLERWLLDVRPKLAPATWRR